MQGRRKIELRCAAENIPAEIVVDLANKEMNESIHISSVKLPDGAKPIISDRDFTIATIAAPTVVKEPEPAAAAAGDASEGDAALKTTYEYDGSDLIGICQIPYVISSGDLITPI